MNPLTGKIHYGQANIEYQEQDARIDFLTIPPDQIEKLERSSRRRRMAWAEKQNRLSLDQLVESGNASTREQALWQKRNAKMARRAAAHKKRAGL